VIIRSPVETPSCTGAHVDLEIPGYAFTHNEITNDQRTYGSDFDAVYGACKGKLRFEFDVNGNVSLPFRADAAPPDAIRALISVQLGGDPDCSANCQTIFNVDIDRDTDGG
jgi:hypothetical protein